MQVWPSCTHVTISRRPGDDRVALAALSAWCGAARPSAAALRRRSRSRPCRRVGVVELGGHGAPVELVVRGAVARPAAPAPVGEGDAGAGGAQPGRAPGRWVAPARAASAAPRWARSSTAGAEGEDQRRRRPPRPRPATPSAMAGIAATQPRGAGAARSAIRARRAAGAGASTARSSAAIRCSSAAICVAIRICRTLEPI